MPILYNPEYVDIIATQIKGEDRASLASLSECIDIRGQYKQTENTIFEGIEDKTTGVNILGQKIGIIRSGIRIGLALLENGTVGNNIATLTLDKLQDPVDDIVNDELQRAVALEYANTFPYHDELSLLKDAISYRVTNARDQEPQLEIIHMQLVTNALAQTVTVVDLVSDQLTD